MLSAELRRWRTLHTTDLMFRSLSLARTFRSTLSFSCLFVLQPVEFFASTVDFYHENTKA